MSTQAQVHDCLSTGCGGHQGFAAGVQRPFPPACCLSCHSEHGICLQWSPSVSIQIFIIRSPTDPQARLQVLTVGTHACQTELTQTLLACWVLPYLCSLFQQFFVLFQLQALPPPMLAKLPNPSKTFLQLSFLVNLPSITTDIIKHGSIMFS